METTANVNRREGRIAKTIEQQTSKIPSDAFLWTSIGAMGVALALKIMGRNHDSLFVGQWAAPFLILGLYNKLVKVEGSVGESKANARTRSGIQNS